MTNYERLCEAAGIKERGGCYNKYVEEASMPCDCDTPCRNCSYYAEKLPDFTAEKQIELIKLIADCKNTTPLGIKTDESGNIHIYCYNTSNIMDKNRTIYTKINADFTEALAGLALQLIESWELNKDEVRRILE